jgi:acyl dehydratase
MAQVLSEAIARSREPWVKTVTRDAIRHFAWAIGDDNPLWTEPDHAKESCWGGLIAPPCLLYAVDETTVAPGLDDQRRHYRRVKWTWFDVVSDGTDLDVQATLTGEHENVESGVVDQHGRVEFLTANGQLIAVAETICSRLTEPLTPIEDRPELRYTANEIDAIEQGILDETRRGATTRYWEDTAVGDDLGTILKGPLSIMDVVAWCAGTQGVATDADGFSDGGLHAETATGPQQVAWIAHLLTDWMGDDAFLHGLDINVISNPPLGSTTSISGHVTKLNIDAVTATAEVTVTAVDQSGEVTAHGSATIAQPSRERGPVVLPMGSSRPL